MKIEFVGRLAIWALLMTHLVTSSPAGDDVFDQNRIQPYPLNPIYWQYQGEPVLLLGGSKTDHIFLLDDLETHLEEIADSIGNYVRCVMSQREGKNLKPHRLLPNGKFDLNLWNEEYWRRFAECLRLCKEHDIIVQIEVWDRFDYSREQWMGSAWRPVNNINYESEESGFSDRYTQPAHRGDHPFFHTLSGSRKYNPYFDGILDYQERFVAKILDISFQFNNVLYCVGNESSAPSEWSHYWAGFIRAKAQEEGVRVEVTQMNDSARFEDVVNHLDRYSFIEGSKLLGPRRQAWAPKGEELATRLVSLRNSMSQKLVPINAVKIITNQDTEIARYSVQKFWRGLFLGFAAIRFHREPAGIALTEPAKDAIRAARMLETRIQFWDLAPRLDLLRERERDEAYLLAKKDIGYAVYFPEAGAVELDLQEEAGNFYFEWIDLSNVEWIAGKEMQAGRNTQIATPGEGAWIAVMTARSGG